MKNKCKSYFGDYKCHVKTSVKDSKGEFVYVDKCLKGAVEELNKNGLKTIASCCGHGIINPKISIDGLCDSKNVSTSGNAEHETLADVSGLFSFYKYINEWYEYSDNTEKGNVYNHVVTGRLMTEQQIFDEWLN